MISSSAVCKAIGMLSLMKFFPGDEATRAALMELLGEMCESDEQVIWLSRRMRNLYSEWPGAHELRAAFCSKFRPKDGIDANSAVYLDGIPSERELSPIQIEAPEQKRLAGEVLEQVNVETTETVIELSTARAMPPVKKFRTISDDEERVDKKLRQMFKLGAGE